MAVKGSRSTINYRAELVIQISSEPGEITEPLVSTLKNYDIFLGMPYLNRHQKVIDCRNVTIMFLKTGYVLQCQRGIQVQFLVAAIPENTPNVFKEFPKVFPLQKPILLPTL
jgi:hypothetical protein